MPTIADLQPIVEQLCTDVANIPGVKDVYIWGSYIHHLNQPSYAVKDIDIIATTNFDSGDLLAIDHSKHSPLYMHTNDLIDEGYNPTAVAFTKTFLTFAKYNVDHWATSKNGKLLHWGAIADSQDEWAELHDKAEKRATTILGYTRGQLYKTSVDKRREWRQVYDEQIGMFLARKNIGWCESSHDFDEIVKTAKKVKYPPQG